MSDDADGARPGRVDFALKRIEDFIPESGLDLLVSNAALQSVPGRRELLAGSPANRAACCAGRTPSGKHGTVFEFRRTFLTGRRA